MPPIWALQGLFLFVIPMVCGLRDPIPRAHAVNLAASAIGIALFAAFVAAPIHAVYRNDHPLGEGRNFYRRAADEVTRLWHAQSDTPLAAVGGDDGLAFALAFYSPDHPIMMSSSSILATSTCRTTSLSIPAGPLCATPRPSIASSRWSGPRRDSPVLSGRISSCSRHCSATPAPFSALLRSSCCLPRTRRSRHRRRAPVWPKISAPFAAPIRSGSSPDPTDRDIEQFTDAELAAILRSRVEIENEEQRPDGEPLN
jgi:hypothetical protein